MRSPCLIESFVSPSDWPALERWHNLELLKSKLGSENIVAHIPSTAATSHSQFVDKRSEVDSLPWDVAIERIFESENSGRLYVKAGLRENFKDDLLTLPNEIFGLGGSSRIKENLVKVWIGSAGNVTPLHFDLCHGVLSQAST